MRNGASTISVSIRWNWSGGNSSIGATCWMPAQFTTMSADRSSPRTAAVSVRSATTASPPRPAAWSATRSSRSSNTTRAPSVGQPPRARRPDPDAAPVTSAVRPLSSVTAPILGPGGGPGGAT